MPAAHQGSVADHAIDETGVLWERRRWWCCCFGWQRPLSVVRWTDGHGRRAERKQPGTDAYRLEVADDPAATQEREWQILVSEATDAEGWQYARCLWPRVGQLRRGGRSTEGKLDFVKGRQWVHMSHAGRLLGTATKGAVHLMDPAQLAARQREIELKTKEGYEQIKAITRQLDTRMDRKGVKTALLHPVALRSMSKAHGKIMQALQARALRELDAAPLPANEVWGPLALPPECKSHEADPSRRGGPLQALQGRVINILRRRPQPPWERSEHKHGKNLQSSQTARAARALPDTTSHNFVASAAKSALNPSAQPADEAARPATTTHHLPASTADRPDASPHGGNVSTAPPTTASPTQPASSGANTVMHNGGPSVATSDGAGKGDLLPPPSPHRMTLSLTELECATGHSLSIYGDLEDYVGTMPNQTYYESIEKYTGVPKQDIAYAVWRSEPFRPAHYVALDRARSKIIVCIRGTMKAVDMMASRIGNPIAWDFGPGLSGVVHKGIMDVAQAILSSIMHDLLAAARQYPQYDLFITGHSLGGGAAGLVALLLRMDTRLAVHQRARLRAVGLSPASVMDKHLSRACQSFIVSIVYRHDIVPRIDLGSSVKFIKDVSQASPIKKAFQALAQGNLRPTKELAAPSNQTASSLGRRAVMAIFCCACASAVSGTDGATPVAAVPETDADTSSAAAGPEKDADTSSAAAVPETDADTSTAAAVSATSADTSSAAAVPAKAAGTSTAATPPTASDSRTETRQQQQQQQQQKQLSSNNMHPAATVRQQQQQHTSNTTSICHSEATGHRLQQQAMPPSDQPHAVADIELAMVRPDAQSAATNQLEEAGLQKPLPLKLEQGVAQPLEQSQAAHAGSSLLGKQEMDLQEAAAALQDALEAPDMAAAPPPGTTEAAGAAVRTAVTPAGSTAATTDHAPGANAASASRYSSGAIADASSAPASRAASKEPSGGENGTTHLPPGGVDSASKALIQPMVPPGSVLWLLPVPQPAKRKKTLSGVLHCERHTQTQDKPTDAPHVATLATMANAPPSGLAQADGNTTTEGQPRGQEGPEAGGQFVLLQADPGWFSELLFFPRAVMDHAPLQYHKALRTHIASAKKQLAANGQH